MKYQWTLCLGTLLLMAGCRGESSAPASSRKEALSLIEDARRAWPETVQATGVVREFTLTAAPTTLPLLGGHPLQVWAYNGQVPGPTLRVRVGDRLRVRLVNQLPQPTTIHWHGVRVPNAMDGTPHISQPPVAPGDSFVYEFVPRDAGTFWFHPHIRSSEQVERGLFGALIVEEATPPPVRDIVWVVDDWLVGDDGQIVPQFNTRHDLAHDGRWGNRITVNGRTDEILDVSPGERLRLRLVNVANGRVFAPTLGALSARVVAVDGNAVAEPFLLDRFEMAPGNRLDLDVVVPASLRGQDVPVVDRFPRRETRLAMVRVRDEDAKPTAELSPQTSKVPRWTAADAVASVTEFRLGAQGGGPLGLSWRINGEAFEGHDHGDQRLAASFRKDQFTRVRFVNESGRLHPMHLHGVFFKVLLRNGQAAEEAFVRDTVLVHPRESVEVGLVPRDEGKWMMHCHVLEHAEAGMMTLFEVKP